MDFTHKISQNSLPMSKVIEEYYKPDKTARFGRQKGDNGKYWSNPPFPFDPKLLLEQFEYLTLIGREYEVPRLDRQKTIGVAAVSGYYKQATERINAQSFLDMKAFEQDHPGVLALMPGHCVICDLEHLGCTRKQNKPCRYKQNMRFSLEGMGLDADTMAKFELGLLTKWPEDGHLPVKLTSVMGFLSNEKFTPEDLKSYFPDAEKDYLNFTEQKPDRPEAKRQSSWIDNQARQRRELEDEEGRRANWIGYKSESLNSGGYVEAQPWKTVDEEEEEPVKNPTENPCGLPSEHLGLPKNKPSLPSEHLHAAPVKAELPTEHLGAMPSEAGLPHEHIQPVRVAPEEPEEQEEETKYKWLGFKRSVDEASENFYNRPIPKFSVSEEEEEPEEENQQESVCTTLPEALQDPECQSVYVSESEPVAQQTIVERQTPPELTDHDISELGERIVQKMMADKAPQQAPAEAEPEVAEPVRESIILPDASSIDNVLGAALSIAKEVSGLSGTKEKEEKTNIRQNYKWLNYKSEVLDEDSQS